MLQLLEIALGHFLKDDLIVVASKFLNTGPHGFETLAESSAFPMLATLLRPERLHGGSDLLLNVLICAGMIAYDHLVCNEEGTWNGCLPRGAQREGSLSG